MHIGQNGLDTIPSTPPTQLRRDAQQIWLAGVEAVRSQRLVLECLNVEPESSVIGNKASATVAPGCRLATATALGLHPPHRGGWGRQGGDRHGRSRRRSPRAKTDGPKATRRLGQRAGRLHARPGTNVPPAAELHRAGVSPAAAPSGPKSRQPQEVRRIHLHAARPAGVNEPTAEGVAGAEEILRLVESLGPDDLCLCLISGGGSALMPAPVEGITLADKLAVTRHLSAAGANIEQLNTVRKQLSRIKGGGLLRACRAGRLVSLIISDVLGDPLDVIASGPTVPDSSTPQAALDVLERFHARQAGIAPAVFEYLQKAAAPRGC